jgi:hypothetical protein
MTKYGHKKNPAKDIYKQETTYLYKQNMYYTKIILTGMKVNYVQEIRSIYQYIEVSSICFALNQ